MIPQIAAGQAVLWLCARARCAWRGDWLATPASGGAPSKAGPPGLCAAVQSFSRGLAWAPGAAHICTA